MDQARPGRPREYDDKAEADLVALACSEPPTGYSQWSLGLLTEVARQQSAALQTVSEGTVRQMLKKRCKPWLKRMWCIGKLTPQYRARMYDVIDLYHQPYNPAEPVVCKADEKSKQLLSDTRVPIAGNSGTPVKQDYEYERHGTRNLFVAVEHPIHRYVCLRQSDYPVPDDT